MCFLALVGSDVVPDAVIQRVLKDARDYGVAMRQPLFATPPKDERHMSDNEAEDIDEAGGPHNLGTPALSAADCSSLLYVGCRNAGSLAAAV